MRTAKAGSAEGSSTGVPSPGALSPSAAADMARFAAPF
jgi:hypothetical protein